MHTKTQLEPRIPLGALAGVIVIAAVVAVLATGVRMRAGTDEPSIPADVLDLATEMTPVSADGKIASVDAISAFERQMGSWDGAEITTYLVRMTSPEIRSIADREVWVLKYDGVEVPFSVPDVPAHVKQSWPEGTLTAGDVLYAFVDAKTGEWLAATNSGK